ncbi:uncharacterized protein LOC129595034 [Paramacrobiotus metropolitanus]|uniref:uncharacterized protein LOC129595034 n=1 Tax=Paramacrobiotus metropolitanus TaxID=2943436 RepID=UPI0024456FFF|nr:uncharacterized protein LOC129595034 [Paramacrobiotus metropolitanus]
MNHFLTTTARHDCLHCKRAFSVGLVLYFGSGVASISTANMANVALFLCLAVLCYVCSVQSEETTQEPILLINTCLDCGHTICADGQFQACDTARGRCVCPTPRSPAEGDRRDKRSHRQRGAASTEEQTGKPPRGSGAASTEETGRRGGNRLSGCIDCGYNMCDNGPMRCDRQTNTCVCKPGGRRM